MAAPGGEPLVTPRLDTVDGGGRRPSLAVVGADSAIGQVALRVLAMREDPWGEIRLVSGQAAKADDGDPPPLAGVGSSEQATGLVRGQPIPLEPLTPEVFDVVEVAVFAVSAEVAKAWAPVAAARGAVVVDKSKAYRHDPDVPLVVPEVNPSRVTARPLGIVSSPNSTTLTFIDALGALNAVWELTEVVVSSYQAASGAGQQGIDRLYDELAVVAGDRTLGQRPGDVRRLIEHELGDGTPFPGPLALNVLPFVGDLGAAGWTTEEETVRLEVRKILGMPRLRVAATCVRVPVVTTHSVAVHATFAQRITVEKARQALIEVPAVVVLDDPEGREFPTPADIVGSDPRFVGRLRQSPDDDHTLDFFMCGDNLRKGAALNMVQVAELVCRELTGAHVSP
jgi:aspartate-semialdehyde dehydrogenase